MPDVYRVLRSVAFRVDPERAHAAALHAYRVPRPRRRRRVGHPTVVMGLEFPNVVGLAAGYDKDAAAWRGLAALGFGHIEVGTVTLRPQPGNPRPRIFRFPNKGALINRMGFPSEGADAVAARLGARRPDGVVLGVSIGPNGFGGVDQAARDYEDLVDRFAPLADYLAINISSPNTPGLRTLEAGGALEELLGRIVARRDYASPSGGLDLWGGDGEHECPAAFSALPAPKPASATRRGDLLPGGSRTMDSSGPPSESGGRGEGGADEGGDGGGSSFTADTFRHAALPSLAALARYSPLKGEKRKRQRSPGGAKPSDPPPVSSPSGGGGAAGGGDGGGGSPSSGTPLVVKLSPDIGSADLESTVTTIEAAGVDGIIVTNTTTQRPGVTSSEDGGLSGAPLRALSLAMLQRVREVTTLPLIASGGIMTEEDAQARLDAGASLVQIYTGFVYGGPRLVRQVGSL